VSARWLVISVFVLSTAINYLDRQTLAALGPLITSEFHLSHAQFGGILTVFSIAYAASAPFAGILIDRLGLNRAIGSAVGLWSCAGIATGLTSGFGSLVACRVVLGFSEAAGIPGAGKAIHQYLKPAERSMGNALNQVGVSLGAIAAPPLAIWLAFRTNWRIAFVITGLLGLVWIPLWFAASRLAPVTLESPRQGEGGRELLRDRRLWIFVAANALAMIGYSLWSNWTTFYLVDVSGISTAETARYAWFPPLFAMAGGLAAGWLSLRLVNRGVAPVSARFRVCLMAAVLAPMASVLLRGPGPQWAAAGASLGFFTVAAFSVNMYSLPLDAFGGARAGFAVSLLVSSYGLVQALVSVVIGKVVDLHGYTPVTTVVAFTPLAACALLWSTRAAR
jgi:ACS family hexuronate transporter-like MFS transporter